MNLVIGRGSLCHPHSGIPISALFSTLFKFEASSIVRPCANVLSHLAGRLGKRKDTVAMAQMSGPGLPEN